MFHVKHDPSAVSRETSGNLLANTEIPEDHIEDILDVDPAGEAAKRRGGQAHFEDAETKQIVPVTAFEHSVSEYVNGGLAAGLTLRALGEHLEEGAPVDAVPRLVSVLFER